MGITLNHEAKPEEFAKELRSLRARLRWLVMQRVLRIMRRLASDVPTIAVIAITGAGAVLAVTQSGSEFDTAAEIGVGLLTGGLIGGALLLIDERREAARDAHDAELSIAQRRHALTTALAVKDELTGIVLAGQDLQGIVLSGRYLTSANLSSADLSGANFNEAILNEADLSGADLNLANLTGTNLTGANLTGADLEGADLTEVFWLPQRPPAWPEGFDPPENPLGGTQN